MAPSSAWNAGCAFSDGAGGGTTGFQPVTAPDSDAKMNAAGSGFATPVAVTLKSVVLFNTWPVGAPPGIATLNGAVSGFPMYTSLRSLPLAETQNAPFGLSAIPHALTSVGSVIGATPGWSAIRSDAR